MTHGGVFLNKNDGIASNFIKIVHCHWCFPGNFFVIWRTGIF